MRLFFLFIMLLSMSSTMGARTLHSKRYQEQCKQFCESDFRCHHCTQIAACGRGYTSNASFGIKEKERWFACQKRGAINAVWPKKGKENFNVHTLIVAVGGFAGSRNDGGIEWFCEEYFPKKLYPDILCISSYGSPQTSSLKLAKNINKTVTLIKKTTKKEPKIVLIGKSLGGCKLHHAVAGFTDKNKMNEVPRRATALKNKTIDLFVGIDVSCSIKRHFDIPDDILYFPYTILHLLSFYQNNPKSKQTGHKLAYKNGIWKKEYHINVNRESVNTVHLSKSDMLPALCSGVTHFEIDDCKPLKEVIRQIILHIISNKNNR